MPSACDTSVHVAWFIATSASAIAQWQVADITLPTDPSPSYLTPPALSWADNNTVVSIGGGFGSALGQFDGVSWTYIYPSFNRVDQAIAYNPAAGRHLIFGGFASNSTYSNETWYWDGSILFQVTPQNSPPERSLASMAFDSCRGRFVVFGGMNTNGPLGDTWEFDGTTWQQVVTTVSPPAQAGSSMAFDPVLCTCILTSNNSETWEFDGTGWTLRSTTTALPTGDGLAFNPSTAGVETVRAGGVWHFDGVDWSLRAAAPTFSFRNLVYDSLRDRFIAHNGSSTLILRDTLGTPASTTVGGGGGLPGSLFPTVPPLVGGALTAGLSDCLDWDRVYMLVIGFQQIPATQLAGAVPWDPQANWLNASVRISPDLFYPTPWAHQHTACISYHPEHIAPLSIPFDPSLAGQSVHAQVLGGIFIQPTGGPNASYWSLSGVLSWHLGF